MTTPRSGSLRQAFRVDLFEGARIALRSLLSHRMRTVLTTIGIGVGVCTLLAIVTVIQGLNRSFEAQMSIIGAQTLQVSKYPWVMRGDWWRYRNRKDIDPRDAELLKTFAPHVAAAAPLAMNATEVRYQGRTLHRIGVGGTSADFPEASGYQLESGRFLTEADEASLGRVAILGKDIV
ncbi:MAG TPA: ABC transporter permease, partial [Myxococcaceae bacterium]|nr:ABC transporter permease [Myxococcaceae bacterium]